MQEIYLFEEIIHNKNNHPLGKHRQSLKILPKHIKK